jgi:hypothetical protein
MTVRQGLNVFNNLQFNQNIITIDGVYLVAEATSESSLGKFKYIDYKANQGGIDIDVFSNVAEDIYVTLSVEGRATGLTDAYVESGVSGTDPKVAKILSLDSYIIQDESIAREYVSKVANYLYRMEQEITLTGVLSPLLTTGVYITLDASDDVLDGNYLVTGFRGRLVGEGYGTTVTLVKVRSV